MKKYARLCKTRRSEGGGEVAILGFRTSPYSTTHVFGNISREYSIHVKIRLRRNLKLGKNPKFSCLKSFRILVSVLCAVLINFQILRMKVVCSQRFMQKFYTTFEVNMKIYLL